MSFLYRSTPLMRTAARASALQQSPRLFSTAIVHQKSATEAVKDGLKKVDRAVSDVAVAGIDKTGMLEPKHRFTDSANTTIAVELKDKASDVAGIESSKAKGKASEVTGEAKGKAAELSGEAKGKAEEVKGKMS
ncbi:hypothetical protein A1O1_06057 [Capronia coronata CBS 617.96]|uniref:LEA domain protein n=1 Tax=Capronia coronata CBS 617.96 TaxID=1182541 RepID=W9YTS7_9EURO|nr:uncharacterized protein A1O1_06057 [Capronia coronata CBS 617.96]EXJ85689.1 hypothetical protein A1O1_06057 [Capronia coronata CBS 617.96]